MSNEEWGTKRACPKCAIRFYDLNKDPIICPCGEEFESSSFEETFKKAPRETNVEKSEKISEIDPLIESEDLENDPIILEDSDAGIELEDELLEDDDDDSVSLEEIADVSTDKEDT
ncbi:MAG: TIGR02300 family protein [Pseudomonadota bacterium]|nr:TIGR02300 family protein [Pseudomonadota bacterium]